jgi:pentatricopeptide repeat protein
MTMDRHPLLSLAGALLVSAALAGPALAAGTTTTTTTYDSADSGAAFNDGMTAANAGDWDLAITKFTIATTEDPESADAFNMLAYSYRNNGDYDQAFRYYDKALELDPNHADAYEYLGEAYLAVDDVAKAEEQLAALDSICDSGCEQQDELMQAISDYKDSH